MRRHRHKSVLFLIGLFSMTEIHVGGFIGISELVLFLIAPFVFIQDLPLLRRDGFMPFLWLVFLTLGGCTVASLANHTPIPFFLRGFSAVYALFACSVCLHRLLRNDLTGVRWVVLGYCFSLIINIFIFQRGASRHGGDVAIMSAAAMQSTSESVLFWTQRGIAWLYAPIKCWYEKVPKWYVLPAAFAAIVVCLFGSGGSGRAAALCATMTFVLLWIGASDVRRLKFMQKNLWLIILCAIGAALVFKMAYQHFATTGALGEAGLKKYEGQTKGGKGILAMIMNGRGEFFSGAYAAVQKPIIGYGPWAVDWNGIVGSFLMKYGSVEDYELYSCKRARDFARGKLPPVPGHSFIVGFWVWYGIFGLMLWVYVLWLLWRVFSSCLSVSPFLFGFLACTMPLMVWDIFFSPFGARIMNSLTIVVCLFLRAAVQGRVRVGGVGINNLTWR